MSRIGKAPIEVPSNVEIKVDGNTVTVKGPLGTLTRTFRPEIIISHEGNVITITRRDESRQARALHGLSRTLLANMVSGTSQGFSKDLEIIGVGYRAQMQGKTLMLQLGYSHPVELPVPEGLQVTLDGTTKLSIKGADKQLVGDFAALIRFKRAPEPYKGKGVKYAGEVIRRKAGKAGKK